MQNTDRAIFFENNENFIIWGQIFRNINFACKLFLASTTSWQFPGIGCCASCCLKIDSRRGPSGPCTRQADEKWIMSSGTARLWFVHGKAVKYETTFKPRMFGNCKTSPLTLLKLLKTFRIKRASQADRETCYDCSVLLMSLHFAGTWKYFEQSKKITKNTVLLLSEKKMMRNVQWIN